MRIKEEREREREIVVASLGQSVVWKRISWEPIYNTSKRVTLVFTNKISWIE